MNREQALRLLHTHIANDQLIKHSLATEAIMARIARELGADADYWGMLGLLHDIDFDQTKDSPAEHTRVAATMLQEAGFDQEFIAIVQSHNTESLGGTRSRTVEFALTAAESITGLIVATALVYPDKKLASVKSSSIKKRMKEKAFARTVSRERVMECEQAGLEFDRFVELSLESMRAISEVLGL